MKKTTKILLAGLLVLGIASCSDSNNSSPSLPSGNTNTDVTTENLTTVIGETTSKKITLTNPFSTDANLTIYDIFVDGVNQVKYSNAIKIDTANTTCGTLQEGNSSIHNIQIQANASCDFAYIHTPNALETTKFSFAAEFRSNTNYNQKFYEFEFYNYAQNATGAKSPDIAKVDLGTVVLTNSQVTADIPAKPFSFNLTEGNTYTISTITGMTSTNWTIKADNTNCQITDNTVTILKTGSCTLNVGYTYNAGGQNYITSPMLIKLTPTVTDNTIPAQKAIVTADIQY